MVGRAARIMFNNPREYAKKSQDFFNNLSDPKWQVQNPFQYRIVQAAIPVGLASFGLSTAAQFMPENELVQGANNLNTWVLNPIIDSASEYIVNRNMSGMKPIKAATLSAGSGAGMLIGQGIASQLFKDEEGNSSPLATTVGGMIGDFAGDYLAEKVWENKMSRDFAERAFINLARHIGKII